MKKLFIHIGYPKCGSSSIQTFLLHNYEALKGKGIGICDSQMNLGDKRSKYAASVPFFKALREENFEVSSKKLSAVLLKFSKLLEEKNLDTLILSAENLSDPFLPELFKGVEKIFDTRVICYIRRHDDWLLSSWKQWNLKRGFSLDGHIRAKCKTKALYKSVLEAWEKVIDRENIEVGMLHPQNLKESDLLSDFCYKIGISIHDMERVEDKNPSFDYDLLRVLENCTFLFDSAHDTSLYEYLSNSFGTALNAPKDQNPLTQDQRKQIMEAYEHENEWLAETYFHGTDFKKWMAPEVDKAYTPPSDFKGLSMMLGLNLKVMLELQEKIEDLKITDLLKLRKRSRRKARL